MFETSMFDTIVSIGITFALYHVLNYLIGFALGYLGTIIFNHQWVMANVTWLSLLASFLAMGVAIRNRESSPYTLGKFAVDVGTQRNNTTW